MNDAQGVLFDLDGTLIDAYAVNDALAAGAVGERVAGVTRAVCSRRLVERLHKKGLRFILLDVAFCKSCGGAVGELFARSAKEAEIQRILQSESGVRRFSCVDEGGNALFVGDAPVELVVVHRGIALADVVTLDIRRLLGDADLRVTGARF